MVLCCGLLLSLGTLCECELMFFFNARDCQNCQTSHPCAIFHSLVEICKALAGSLGMEEVGIGPIKETQAALKKAERKYDGDLLKITDFCRALLVVKDLPSLLALLELARDSFGPLIRRVKLSSLKSDHKPLPGGYRHCIINLELKEHICEITARRSDSRNVRKAPEVHVWHSGCCKQLGGLLYGLCA